MLKCLNKPWIVRCSQIILQMIRTTYLTHITNTRAQCQQNSASDRICLLNKMTIKWTILRETRRNKRGVIMVCIWSVYLSVGPLNASLFSSGVQELLAAIQPNLFDLRDQQSSHHRRHSMSTNSPSPSYLQSCANDSATIRTLTPKHSPIRNSHFDNR